MFIELTDHLRCTAEHDESFVVLFPDVVERRSVHSGVIACPVCDRRYPVVDGIATFDDAYVAPPLTLPPSDAFTAEALHAFVGLSGPGGYVAMVGDVASMWRELAALQVGVALIAVNAPSDVADDAPQLSVVRASILPVRARSMRGVVLGAGYGASVAWIDDAVRVTLPGLRVIGAGAAPVHAGLETLAEAGGWWVARRINM